MCFADLATTTREAHFDGDCFLCRGHHLAVDCPGKAVRGLAESQADPPGGWIWPPPKYQEARATRPRKGIPAGRPPLHPDERTGKKSGWERLQLMKDAKEAEGLELEPAEIKAWKCSWGSAARSAERSAEWREKQHTP